MPAPRDFIDGPWRAVSVLGVTQIVSWGAIFYTPVLMVPLIAAERGRSMSFAMGGFSLALLVAGLIAPYVGRSIVADATGLHRNTINNVEVGRYRGDPATLKKIEKVLVAAGVEFIDENGGGPGVRLRKRQRAKQSK